MKAITSLLVALIITWSIGFSQDGPGGVGSTDGTSELVMWLKADAGVSVDGDNHVTEWSDQSGYHANALPAPFSGSPLYVTGNPYPYLDFNNDEGLSLDNLLAVGSGSTIIMVTKEFNGKKMFRLTGVTGTMKYLNNRFYRYDDATDYIWQTHPCNFILPQLEARIISMFWSNNAYSFDYFINGVSSPSSRRVIGNPNSLDGSFNSLSIGDNVYYSEHGFHGKVMEVIVYNRNLSEEETDAVNQYLACKYNIPVGFYCSDIPECNEKISTAVEVGNDLSIYPNPATSLIKLTVNTVKEAENAEMIIVNSVGQELIRKNIKLNKGNNELTFEIVDIPTGNYFIALKSKSISFNGKFAKSE